ncbi:MAG: TonB-dependent copper receptor [Lysobacteraceae bacterium]|nr:MAG: TonB-dependent copper receptor [Xanthomonadaceae bacterium]
MIIALPATAVPSRCTLACAIAVALLAAAACHPAHAAEPSELAQNEADVVTTTLARVVVTASPVQPLTFTLDPRLPRQPVPASDGADYLKTIPGFSALRNGGTNGDPVLRGMFGSRLNLLTNGGAMPGACPSRMDNPLSYVGPETYDRLEVVKGPQTVLWGPGASAGTVRFDRDTPRFEQPGARVRGSVLGGNAGRNDQVLDATVGATAGYARLSANRSEAGDYASGNGTRVPSAWKKWNGDLALGWTPDADTLVELTAGAGDGVARYAGRSMDGAQFRRDSLGLRAERAFDGVLRKFEANAYQNVADHVMDNYSLRTPNPSGPMPMPMASNVERRTEGGRIAATFEWDAIELVAGLDSQDSVHRARKARGVDAYKDVAWATDAEFRNTGVFGEATWTLAPGQRIVAGARVDRATVDDERATVGKMMPKPNPTFGQQRRETLPGGFARFEKDIVGTGFGWYAGLGHVERMPDYWELFSPEAGPAGASNAFAGVDPERTTQLDLGAQYRGARMDAWVSAYAGRIDDFILFRYQPAGMTSVTSQASNVDARIHGAEAGVEFRPTPAWTLGATTAWAWGANTDDGTPLPQMTPAEARITAAWAQGRWSAGALLRAVRAQTRIAIDQGNVVGRDLGPSPGFATLALNAGVQLRDGVQLTAGVDNLFDRAYSEHLNLAGNADFGYPAMPVRIDEPGRTTWVKLGFEF